MFFVLHLNVTWEGTMVEIIKKYISTTVSFMYILTITYVFLDFL